MGTYLEGVHCALRTGWGKIAPLDVTRLIIEYVSAGIGPRECRKTNTLYGHVIAKSGGYFILREINGLYYICKINGEKIHWHYEEIILVDNFAHVDGKWMSLPSFKDIELYTSEDILDQPCRNISALALYYRDGILYKNRNATARWFHNIETGEVVILSKEKYKQLKRTGPEMILVGFTERFSLFIGRSKSIYVLVHDSGIEVNCSSMCHYRGGFLFTDSNGTHYFNRFGEVSVVSNVCAHALQCAYEDKLVISRSPECVEIYDLIF